MLLQRQNLALRTWSDPQHGSQYNVKREKERKKEKKIQEKQIITHQPLASFVYLYQSWISFQGILGRGNPRLSK